MRTHTTAEEERSDRDPSLPSEEDRGGGVDSYPFDDAASVERQGKAQKMRMKGSYRRKARRPWRKQG